MRAPLDEALAGRLARVALDAVAREYPNRPDHVWASAADGATPRALHPAFYGSYDWHSSVHMHWTLATILARFPALPEATAIAATFDAHLSHAGIAAELAYLARPGSAAFERPYGWAWLLKLAAALHGLAVEGGRAVAWRDALQPFADAIVARAGAYLPRIAHPSRVGSHANTAFATLLMLDYAETAGTAAFRDLLVARALAWYGGDRDYPIAYEMSSEDFLSNGLVEAALVRRAFGAARNDPGLAAARFSQWWHGFVPDIAALARWLEPLVPVDRDDARLAHVDGLNLSRAWCWALLVDHLPDALRTPVELAIHAHRSESLPHAVDGPWVGTHWLASFALLSLDC